MFKKMMQFILPAFLCFSLAACSSNNKEQTETKKEDTSSQKEETNTVKGSVEGGKKYLATIEVEGYGPIQVELDEGIAPKTVDNFVKLANEGFYNGLTFHRIIDGFMIQGGDPQGNGTGGSDETVEGEFSSNGFNNTLSHTRGVISMARSSDPNSASSQFFIVQEDSPYLDGEYAAFGHVVEGMDIVDALAQNAVPTDNNGSIDPSAQPVITSITVSEE